MYKMILENLLHNVRFTPGFFRGNLHLEQEKSARLSTVRFIEIFLREFGCKSFRSKRSCPPQMFALYYVRFRQIPLYLNFFIWSYIEN